MSILGWLFGGGVSKAATGIADAVDRFVETPEEKKAAAIIRRKLELEPAKEQTEINKIQAAHSSIFVAGARPALLWVCATGFFFSFIVNPILQWITDNPGPQMPVDIMMELTLGMLGLAVLRTVEKIKGVARNR